MKLKTIRTYPLTIGNTINPSNRLLYFLFSNVKIAEKLHAWKPIGDYINERLERLGQKPSTDQYNNAIGRYNEEDKWQCPIFIGIRFFDIMVSEAIHQNIKSNMWLYYLPLFSERIVRNYNYESALIDTFTEWPTKYSYLLHEIIKCVCNWTETSIGVNQELLEYSLDALARCTHSILSLVGVDKKYTFNLTGMVFKTYFALRSHDGMCECALGFLEDLKKEGSYRKNSQNYRNSLLCAFERVDKLHFDRKFVEEAHRILEG